MVATAEQPGTVDRAGDALLSRVFATADIIQQWADTHRTRVAVCYLVYNRGAFELVVIGRTAEFDFGLNRELADLSIRLHADGLPVAALLFSSSAPEPPVGPVRPIRIIPA